MNRKAIVIASSVVTVSALAIFWLAVAPYPKEKRQSDATQRIPHNVAQEGDLETKIKEAGQAIERNPKSAEAYEKRGELYSEKLDRKRAIADLTQAIELDHRRDSPYLKRSQVYWNLYQPSLALADASTAISLRPSAEAYTLRSTYYLARKDFNLARKDIEESVRLNKNYPHTYICRFNLNLQTGHKQEAMQDARLALSMAPFPETHLLLGQVFRAHNDFGNALKEVNQAIASSPGPSGLFYFERAGILEGMKRYKEAAGDYSVCLQLMPVLAPYSYFGRGKCFRRMGNYRKAVSDYSAVIKAVPEADPKLLCAAYEERADTWIALGEAEHADRDIQMLIDRFPNIVNVPLLKQRRPRLLIAQKRFAEALVLLNELIKSNPPSAEALEQRARIYEYLGQSERARKDQRRIEELQANQE